MENPSEQSETVFSLPVRNFLEWSWDYALAEDFRTYSIKDVAREIGSGVLSGRDAADEVLVRNFLENRVEDLALLTIVGDGWEPTLKDNELDLAQLQVELFAFPTFLEIKKEIEEERED